MSDHYIPFLKGGAGETSGMGKLKKPARPVLYNWKAAALFELLYKMAVVVLFVPLLFGTVSLAMRAEGYAYLTHENVRAFFGSPLTLALLIADLAVAAVCLLIDVSAVLFLLDRSLQRRAVTPAQTLRFAVRGAVRALRLKNLPLIPVTAALLPLLSAPFLTVFFTAVSIPAPVLERLERMPALPLTAAGAALVLAVLGVRWMYTAFYFTLEGCSFREARRRCARLGRGKRARDILAMAGAQAVLAAASLALLLALTALAGGVGRVLVGVTGQEWLGSYAVWLAVELLLALTAAAAVPAGFACAGVLFYRRKAQAGERIVPVPREDAPAMPRRAGWKRALTAAGAAALTAAGLTILLWLGGGKLNPDVEYLHTVEITAHRGASACFPENTMAAFSGALELGADWIELDVQQSGDGQLVVMHDANLQRTTGVDAYVWEMTGAQLAALDAGGSFGGEYAGEGIPLLSDVLAFAKENEMKLNIELKPTGRETGLEQAVVDAIHAAEMEEQCVVTSQAYQVLENVKACDETIATGYVTRFVYGSVRAMSAADNFSVEAAGVTPALVLRAHNAGKQLYAWTVNTRRSIEKLIEMNVDNIITDDVDLAKQCVYDSRRSDLLEEYIDLLG